MVRSGRGQARPGDAATPLITIATVVRNGGSAFLRTVRSVIRQRDTSVEYVVVDGMSTDGTSEAIGGHKYGIDRVLVEPDHGIYDAMNKAVALARGRLLCFLNAGDELVEGALDSVSRRYAAAGANESVVYFGDYEWVSASGERRRVVRARPSGLRRGMTLCHQAVYVPLALYKKYGLYDLGYQLVADYAFLHRLHSAGVRFYKAEGTLATFRAGGASDRYFIRQKRESFRIHRHDTLPRKCALLAWYFREAASGLLHGHARLDIRQLFERTARRMA